MHYWIAWSRDIGNTANASEILRDLMRSEGPFFFKFYHIKDSLKMKKEGPAVCCPACGGLSQLF